MATKGSTRAPHRSRLKPPPLPEPEAPTLMHGNRTRRGRVAAEANRAHAEPRRLRCLPPDTSRSLGSRSGGTGRRSGKSAGGSGEVTEDLAAGAMDAAAMTTSEESSRGRRREKGGGGAPPPPSLQLCGPPAVAPAATRWEPARGAGVPLKSLRVGATRGFIQSYPV
jgi:hypothetical protein